MNIYDVFDTERPIVYVIYSVLVAALVALRVSPRDTLFVLMNVIIYTGITSGIFYGYTKYEEKKITEKYIKDMLRLLYDADAVAYNAMIEKLKQPREEEKPVHFVHTYSTLILAISFACISFVYYLLHRSDISTNSIIKNGYFLFILGMTELFITFVVMTHIPHPDIMNVVDVVVRKREACSLSNVQRLSRDNTVKISKSCLTFSKPGDTCEAVDQGRSHTYTCSENGKLKRNINKVI